jgi:ligand-binding sensor domain-containing protein
MADGLVGDEIMCMLEDPEGNLWLGQELGLTRIAASVLQSWP